MLAEEAAAAEMLRQAARVLRKARPAAWPAGGGISPFSSPQRTSQRVVQPRLGGATDAPPSDASPPDPPRISGSDTHCLAAARHEQSSHVPASSPQQAEPSATCEQTAAAANTGTSSTASDSAEITSGEPEQLPAAAEPTGLPSPEEPSGPPLAAEPPPVRRRAKLESLDKLIGQQPDVVRFCHQQRRLYIWAHALLCSGRAGHAHGHLWCALTARML